MALFAASPLVKSTTTSGLTILNKSERLGAKGTDIEVPETTIAEEEAAISAPPIGITPGSRAAAVRTVDPILPNAPFTATVISDAILSSMLD